MTLLVDSTERIVLDEETLEDVDGGRRTAFLSLAWALRRGSNERILLSGTVELDCAGTPHEFEGSLHSYELSDRFLLFSRKYELSGSEGLAWYRSCARGEPTLPNVERVNTPLACQ